jgi:dolichol-phosphate mannosyltransferase
MQASTIAMASEFTEAAAPLLPAVAAPEVSVIVPAFNEEESLPAVVEALRAALQETAAGFELVIVNDGSSDGTERVLGELAQRHPFVVAVNLSRNFGKEAAMSAGMEHASGRCVAFIDADMQHPPGLLAEMIQRWREGCDVVNAVKRSRGEEPILYRAFAGAFNWMMSASIGRDVAGASDYKLIDRQVVDALRECPERNRFFRGLVAWAGYRVAEIPFDVQERVAGRSKWSVAALVRYSLRNVIAFTSFPLLLVAYAGFAVVALGLFLLAQTLVRYFEGASLAGFTTVIALQILLSGMILFALGIIAVYIAKIYDEQKSRPIFLVRNRRNDPGTGPRT